MITVRFTVTREEYARAFRHLRLRSRACWVAPISGVVFIALGAVVTYSAFWAGLYVGIGAMYLWSFVCGFLIGPASFAGRAAQAAGESTYTFSDDSFVVETQRSKSTVDWSEITKRFRAGGLTVLIRRPGLMHVIPDRAFDSPDEHERFVELATRARATTPPPEPPPSAPLPRLGPPPGESALERIASSLRRRPPK
jgi:hypothetical protein